MTTLAHDSVIREWKIDEARQQRREAGKEVTTLFLIAGFKKDIGIF